MTISNVAMMALSWFAGLAGSFGDALDRAPEYALVRQLLDAGLLRASGESYEPTAKGDALLDGERIVLREETIDHGDAVAVVRTIAVGRTYCRTWTETTVHANGVRFGYSDDRSRCPVADRATSIERIEFCSRAAARKGYCA